SVAGRFLSVDPGRDYDPKNPQSFNLYAYVRNNPVSATDPDGRVVFAAVPAWYLGAGFVAAAGAYLMAPSVTHPGKSNAQVMGETLVSLATAFARPSAAPQDLRRVKDNGARESDWRRAALRVQKSQQKSSPRAPWGGRNDLPPGAPGPGTQTGERPHLQNAPDETDFLRLLPGAELLRRVLDGGANQTEQPSWRRPPSERVETLEDASKVLVKVTETSDPATGQERK
ncbi:RHS repeat-associated core domain-containing protein, partial [Thermogutta sp.]|uniref:RHS repeat-associated core domain-containing protein n=1 Tax=Thermogutta sp. TaxID=1962930 RepID=UPI00321F67D7